MINISKIGTEFSTLAYKPMQKFIERPKLIHVNLKNLKYSPSIALEKETLEQLDRINEFSAKSMLKTSDILPTKKVLSETKSQFSIKGFEFDKDFEPKSLKKLFSEKYKPTRRFDENGNPVTTIIDRKSQEPVEVYIKMIEEGNEKEGKEAVYHMYKKLINGEDELIGKRSFGFDNKNKCLTPGSMESFCKDKYEGVGTRLHQIAVEQAMLKNYNAIELLSLDQAYVFHKKSLFEELTRLSSFQKEIRKQQEESINEMYKVLKETGMSEQEIVSIIQEERKNISIPYTILEKNDIENYKEIILKKLKDAEMNINETEFNSCLVFDEKNNFYNKDKIEENIRRLMYQKYNKVIPLTTSINMSLEGNNLEYWKSLAQSQPIFI